MKEPLFDMGRLVATRAVAVTMDEDPQFRKRIDAAVLRHISGDFGAIPAEDVTANLEDLKDAQIHPERHGNLIVRIGGFSIEFVQLDRRAQDEIISRYAS